MKSLVLSKEEAGLLVIAVGIVQAMVDNREDVFDKGFEMLEAEWNKFKQLSVRLVMYRQDYE